MKLMNFKDNLKKLIELRSLKLGDISKATGIPKSTLSEWTAGREPKVTDSIIRLAQFLDVSLEYLFTGRNDLSQEHQDLKLNIQVKLDGKNYLLKMIKLNQTKHSYEGDS